VLKKRSEKLSWTFLELLSQSFARVPWQFNRSMNVSGLLDKIGNEGISTCVVAVGEKIPMSSFVMKGYASEQALFPVSIKVSSTFTAILVTVDLSLDDPRLET
jgi:hypothetical protein